MNAGKRLGRLRRGTQEAPEPASLPARRARKEGRSSLAARLSELEARVAELEEALAKVLPPEPPPPPPPPKQGPRCPGCHLVVAAVDHGRCEWCGFYFDVVADLQRARKRDR